MFVDRAPPQVRLAAQRHAHLVQVPSAARLAPGSLDATGEARAEFVAPATDRLVADYDASFEQQLLDVTQAQVEPIVPTHRATDDRRRETMAVIERFRLLLRYRFANVTMPNYVLHVRLSAALQPRAEHDRNRLATSEISVAMLRHLDQENHRCRIGRSTGRVRHQISSPFFVNTYVHKISNQFLTNT